MHRASTFMDTPSLQPNCFKSWTSILHSQPNWPAVMSIMLSANSRPMIVQATSDTILCHKWAHKEMLSHSKSDQQLHSPIRLLLLHRHVAHLAANALYSSASSISIPGLRNPSDVALRLILEVLHTLSRQASRLRDKQQVRQQF